MDKKPIIPQETIPQDTQINLRDFAIKYKTTNVNTPNFMEYSQDGVLGNTSRRIIESIKTYLNNANPPPNPLYQLNKSGDEILFKYINSLKSNTPDATDEFDRYL